MLRRAVRLLLLPLCLVGALVPAAFAQGISALATPLLLPTSVAFDSQGNLYVAETNNQFIRRIDSNGNLTAVAGNGTQGFAGDTGPATSAELDSPAGIALDAANNLYIADSHNQRIRRVDATTGIITTVAGAGAAGFSGDGGLATLARLNLPSALALDTAGNLYIADTNNHRVRKVAAASGMIATVAGNGLQHFGGDGAAATAASIDSPSGLTVDGAGNLYLADTHNQRVRMVSAASGLISTLAGTGLAAFRGDNALAADAALALPRGVSVDGAGNVYVADANNQRIRRVTPQGMITTIAGDGTQGLAGEGGAAIAASLNMPRATTVSVAGLVTIADTGNGRVRQVGSDATIVTIAGLSDMLPSALTVAAPSMAGYGTGMLTAALTTRTQATGQITFLDSTASGTQTLGSAPLAGNAASLGVGTLPVGIHHIVCNYSGDRTHAAAQSTPALLTIAAAPLTASARSVSILYGQPIPTLMGTLNGVVQQDQGRVALMLSTGAVVLSPAGSYPMVAGLSGPAAGNYILAPFGGASLTIARTPSIATLYAARLGVVPGQPVSLAVHVGSTTSGSPTGGVTLLDGTAALADVRLSPTGDVSYSTSVLSAGPHTLSAVYAGDANFLASTAAAQTLVAAPALPGDFVLATTGASSQTVIGGNPASFAFAVQMQGAPLASPITLAVSTLPVGMTASFSPTYLPPGGAVTAFTLTIQTPKTAAWSGGHALFGRSAMGMALLLIPLLPFGFRRRCRLAGLFCAACLVMLSGCGDRTVSSANSTASSRSYPLTVSGTATGATAGVLLHTATVTLQVQ